MHLSLNCDPRQFGFNTQIEAYNQLRYVYQELAGQAVYTLNHHFAQLFPDLETFHQDGLNFGRTYIQQAIEQAIQHLVAYGIHNIDEQKFFATYTDDYNLWDDAYEQIDDQFVEIMANEAEKDAHRTARRQNRGKWDASEVSNEFIKGALGATALNLTSGLAHALWNVGAKGVSKANENRKKADILNAEETRHALIHALYYSILNMHYTVIECIHLYFPETELGFSDASRHNAASLLNNIKKGYIPSKQIRQALAEAVLCDPYNPEVYRQWVYCYPTEYLEVGQFAAYFHIEVHPELRETLEAKAKTLDFSNQERAQAALEILQIDALNLRYADWAVFSENKINTAIAYEREQRMVNGKVYPTLEAAHAAREDIKKRTVKGVLYRTVAEAEAIRSQKHVGTFLGLLILFMPLIGLWTLRKGYSRLARILCLGWSGLWVFFILSSASTSHPPKSVIDPHTPAVTASPTTGTESAPTSPPETQNDTKIMQLPFVGTRYFNFHNSDAQKIMITIENDGTTLVKSVQENTILYHDLYKEQIPVGGNKTLRIHDNEISLFENEQIVTGCLDDQLDCTVILTTE